MFIIYIKPGYIAVIGENVYLVNEIIFDGNSIVCPPIYERYCSDIKTRYHFLSTSVSDSVSDVKVKRALPSFTTRVPVVNTQSPPFLIPSQPQPPPQIPIIRPPPPIIQPPSLTHSLDHD